MLCEHVHLGFCSGEHVIVVPDDYPKISWAVGNASEGDTIFVKSGVYPESSILVNKTLTIVGENAETTVIDGEGTAQYIFHVIASNVVIENLTLQNTDTSSAAQDPAVRIYNVTHAKVKNVVIRNVYDGVHIWSSNFTEIMYCKISGNVNSGIFLRSVSCNNTFVGNTIENNPNGIWIAEPTSQFNKFYHNNLINNTNQIVTFGGVDYFDNGYPSGGNYWSDHIATDLYYGPGQNLTGSDGIFDEGYPAYVPWDNYPLAHPLTSFNVPVDNQSFLVQVSTNVTITACSLNISKKSLNLFANGSLDTGYACRVAIPKALLSCENLTYWNITIYYSDSSWQRLSLDDAENTYLFFSYNQTTSEARIEIKGTKVIPEFSNITVLIILLTTVTLATAIFKAKLIKMKKKN